MKGKDKTKKQLINELIEMRKRISELEEAVTERKQAEEVLQKSEEKFKIIMENIHDVIFQLSPLGFIQYVSPNVKELYGYKPKDLIGKHLKKTTLINEVPKALEALKSVLSGKVIKNLEINRLDSKGKIVPMEVIVTPVKKDGKIIAVQGVMRDITERKQAEEELRISATTDALTGVLNRRFGLLLFGKQLQLSKRSNSKLSICYLDVDDLKKINDTYGHQEGDEVLRLVSKLSKEILREADIICRLGGDEFLLILPQCSVNKAIIVWKRIAKKLAAFNARKMKPYSITLSRGFAECNSTDEKSVDQLIAIADQGMYKDKHSKSVR